MQGTLRRSKRIIYLLISRIILYHLCFREIIPTFKIIIGFQTLINSLQAYHTVEWVQVGRYKMRTMQTMRTMVKLTVPMFVQAFQAYPYGRSFAMRTMERQCGPSYESMQTRQAQSPKCL